MSNNLDTLSCIRIYSDTNPWINFVFIIESYCDFRLAEEIINEKYESWWYDIKAHDIPILDWIGQALEEKNIVYKVYYQEKGDEN